MKAPSHNENIDARLARVEERFDSFGRQYQKFEERSEKQTVSIENIERLLSEINGGRKVLIWAFAAIAAVAAFAVDVKSLLAALFHR